MYPNNLFLHLSLIFFTLLTFTIINHSELLVLAGFAGEDVLFNFIIQGSPANFIFIVWLLLGSNSRWQKTMEALSYMAIIIEGDFRFNY